RFLRRRPLDPPQFALKRLTGAKFRERLALGFLRRRAARERLPVAVVEMLRDLTDDSRLARRLQLQIRQQLTDLFIPFTHVQPPSPKKCTVGCPTCGGLNNEPFSCYLASWLSSPPQVGQPTVLSAAPFHSSRFAPETPGTISGQSESFTSERHH